MASISQKRRMASILSKLLDIYHWTISPWFGVRCRYVPSCSEYAKQALQHHGVFKGGCLALRRLSRCHPWGGTGLDPVPHCECQSEHAHITSSYK